MRTTVIAVAVVSMVAFHTDAASAAGARNRVQRVKASVARYTPDRVKRTVNGGLARLPPRGRQARAERRDLRRGKALADVKLHGKTKIRSIGDLRYSPAVHGAASFFIMTGLGFKAPMAAIAGAVIFLSSRSASKTSDGWLALENRSIEILEREGPVAAKERLRNQGVKNPDAALEKLQQNRHRRNGSYQTSQ